MRNNCGLLSLRYWLARKFGSCWLTEMLPGGSERYWGLEHQISVSQLELSLHYSNCIIRRVTAWWNKSVHDLLKVMHQVCQKWRVRIKIIINAQIQAQTASKNLNTFFGKLSSGFAINNVKNGATVLQILNPVTSQIQGLDQAAFLALFWSVQMQCRRLTLIYLVLMNLMFELLL